MGLLVGILVGTFEGISVGTFEGIREAFGLVVWSAILLVNVKDGLWG